MIILGLDGLEYDIVLKHNFENLKQKYFGRLEVPIGKYNVPRSPSVWYSFLTGEWNTTIDFSRGRPYDLIMKILENMRRYIPVSLGLGRAIVKHRAPIRFPATNKKTFLDETNIIPFNVPFVNSSGESFKITHQILEGKGLASIYLQLRSLYQRRTRALYSFIAAHLDDDIFAYIHFPDCIQHICFHQPTRIKAMYELLDKFVKHVRLMRFSDKLIIVSDHGFDFETETHSMKGFWSSSFKIEPEPMKITDFYWYFKDRT